MGTVDSAAGIITTATSAEAVATRASGAEEAGLEVAEEEVEASAAEAVASEEAVEADSGMAAVVCLRPVSSGPTPHHHYSTHLIAGGNPSGGVTPMYNDFSAAASPYRGGPGPSSTRQAGSSGPTTIPDTVLRNGNWCGVDLCIHVRSTFEDDDLHGLEGSIRKSNAQRGAADVYFDTLDMEKPIPFEYLLPVRPSEGDQVRVIYGDQEGLKGSAKALDEEKQEAVVIQSGSGEMHVVPMGLLCKMY